MRSISKIRILIIFVIIGLLLGYIVGNYLPVAIFKPEFTDGTLSKGEYYRMVISVISAIITFCAVFVALFKDDLRELWKRPKIEFCEPSAMTIEDTSSSFDSESENDPIKASRYLSRIEVHNKGNLAALNTEIYLDKLEFTPMDTGISQQIEASSSALKWNGAESKSIIIPPGGRKLINIVEIAAPEKTSTPESNNINNKASIIIGNLIQNKENRKGKWTAEFTLYAQNHQSVRFEVEAQWNGLWKDRLAEFKNQYSIEKKAK